MKASSQFIELVGVKWGVNSEAEKSPDRYKDEKLQYIHGMGQEFF